LLAVAVKVFYANGYAETTLQHIADEMGFTKPAIYYYARNKEELLLAIYAQIVEPAIEEARTIAEGSGDGAQRLIVLIRQHLRTFLDNVEANAVFEVQRTSLSTEAMKQVQTMGREYGGILTGVYAEGVAEGSLVDVEASIAINALLGMCNSVHRWFHPNDRLGIDQLIDQVVAIVSRGIIRTPSQPDWPLG